MHDINIVNEMGIALNEANAQVIQLRIEVERWQASTDSLKLQLEEERAKNVKTILTSDRMGGVLFDIQRERDRQEILRIQGKFVDTCASRTMTDPEKLAVLAEEFGEASREVTEAIIFRAKIRLWEKEPEGDDNYGKVMITKIVESRQRLRKELIEVAAVAVAWCEALDVDLLDDRAEFPAEEQASLSTNLADLKACICKPYNGPGSYPGDKIFDPKCPSPKHERMGT